jgi:hypothetical protein
MPEPVTGHLDFGTGVVVVPDPYFARDLPAAEGNMKLVGRPGRLYLDHAARLGSSDRALRACTDSEMCRQFAAHLGSILRAP